MMKLYTYLSIPGLIIHEISHIIIGALCGYFFDFKQSYINRTADGGMYVGLVAKKDTKNWIQSILVPMSPLMVAIVTGILGFFNPIFLGILIYFLVTYVYSLPSFTDFTNVRYAKVFQKYTFNDPTFIRFMEFKGIYKKNELVLDVETMDAP